MPIPSPAQQEALQRNYKIYQLRSMYARCYMVFDPDLEEMAKLLIDQQLLRLGADTEAYRRSLSPDEYVARIKELSKGRKHRDVTTRHTT